jgi:CubicO group peptidase (beta-lactamase class C family)
MLATAAGTLAASTAATTASPRSSGPRRPFTGTVAGPSDPAELEAFFDDAMATEMADGDIAGGVIAVVAAGDVVFQEGYGYADVAGQRPVVPATTMFRVGSITKLFTATAVMQLVEQGKLALDADVTSYLDFDIPDSYDQPVTLATLLTHTSGFESRWIGMWPDSEDGLEPLGDWLASHVPDRVRPPGVVAAYSNYGAALAGYIVERVSGEAYADYIDRHVLAPLGMEHSTAQQPLPDHLLSSLSKGYEHSRGQLDEVGFEWLNMAPAGVVSSSAGDMARFMVAHLHNGLYADARILDDLTAALMHAQHFTNATGFNGIAYGFYEMNRNDQAAIGHGGDTQQFHSVLALFPEHDLGLFVAFNSADAASSAEDLRDAFVEHFFPTTTQPAEQIPINAQQLDQLTGAYRLTNTAYSTVEKITGLFGSYRISADAGMLVVSAPADDEMLDHSTTRFVPVRPNDPEQLAFRELDGTRMLVFRTDGRTGMRYASLDQAPVFSLEQLGGLDDPRLHQISIAALVLILISGMIGAAAATIRTRRRNAGPSSHIPERAARWTMTALGTLSLLLVAGLTAVFIGSQSLIAGDTTLLAVVLVIPILIALCTIVACPLAVLAWKSRSWGISARIHLSLVAVAGVLLTVFLDDWNLIGWRY